MFGERAGRFAAETAMVIPERPIPPIPDDISRNEIGDSSTSFGPLFEELQVLMWEKVGLFRTEEKLTAALKRIREMRTKDLPAMGSDRDGAFTLGLQEWHDLRAALLTAEAVTVCALNRTESRGAHQREDWPETDTAYAKNQIVRLKQGAVETDWMPLVRQRETAQ